MKYLYLAFVMMLGAAIARAQPPAGTPVLPPGWQEKVDPLLDKACTCAAQREPAGDDAAFRQCLEPLGEALSHLEQQAMATDRNLPAHIHRYFEGKLQACVRRQHTSQLTEEERAALRNAFHQAFVHKLDTTDPVDLAEEVARAICACKTPQDIPGELPCADRVEIMTALFDQHYRDEAELVPKIAERTQPILEGCR
ncbi:MAG: hypothetical protein KF690_05690 [Bacteroidetes bacterium]|nr:hypothetical protein [Bacteroidota bacterium]